VRAGAATGRRCRRGWQAGGVAVGRVCGRPAGAGGPVAADTALAQPDGHRRGAGGAAAGGGVCGAGGVMGVGSSDGPGTRSGADPSVDCGPRIRVGRHRPWGRALKRPDSRVGSCDCGAIVTWKRSHSKTDGPPTPTGRCRPTTMRRLPESRPIPTCDIDRSVAEPALTTFVQVRAARSGASVFGSNDLGIGSFTNPKRGLQSATIIDGSAPIEMYLQLSAGTCTGGGPARTPPPTPYRHVTAEEVIATTASDAPAPATAPVTTT
jgi:hypothetical protein